MNCIRELSPRQRDVARLVAEGLTDKQIAAKLEISVLTVRVYLHRIRRRLNLDPTRNVRVLIAQRIRAA